MVGVPPRVFNRPVSPRRGGKSSGGNRGWEGPLPARPAGEAVLGLAGPQPGELVHLPGEPAGVRGFGNPRSSLIFRTLVREARGTPERTSWVSHPGEAVTRRRAAASGSGSLTVGGP